MLCFHTNTISCQPLGTHYNKICMFINLRGQTPLWLAGCLRAEAGRYQSVHGLYDGASGSCRAGKTKTEYISRHS